MQIKLIVVVVFLIVTAAATLVTCLFSILLNALIMVAVKTRRRLQTRPSILLIGLLDAYQSDG